MPWLPSPQAVVYNVQKGDRSAPQGHGLRSSPIRRSLGVRLQNVRKRAIVSFHRMCLRYSGKPNLGGLHFILSCCFTVACKDMAWSSASYTSGWASRVQCPFTINRFQYKKLPSQHLCVGCLAWTHWCKLLLLG
jgi:hypothetical protein